MKKVIAFLPAKGTSERIQNKNLAVLDGEYLFKRKLRQLLECKLIDKVVLDTDCDKIAALASDLPIDRLMRPFELASNKTDGHELFAWECSQYSADIYIQVLCTAPFVNTDTIERAILALSQSTENDSIVAVTNNKLYTWKLGDPEYGRGRIPNSVDLPHTTIEAMSLYAVKSSALPLRKRFGDSPLLFELSPLEAVDVNWPVDLQLAETIASGLRARENSILNSIFPYLSTAMISDITREMGFRLTLPKELVGNGRFFGRAKTLLLDQPLPTESWEGIYDGLNTYQFIRPGDVIVVENRVKDRAYFGSINAQLARRAGAIGAVINGVTRDKEDVARLNFPVFAKGHYCVDIKFEGTVRSMNMPIKIEDVAIANGDYIFADSDGVTVIPQHLWPKVREEALKAIEKEWRVGMAVALGRPPKEILGQFGEF